jgi:ribosomal protein L11 methyltransferase
MKNWQAVEFEIEQEQEELACWLMIQLGSNGCRVQSQSATNTVLVSAIFDEMSCGSFIELRKSLKQYDLEPHLRNLRTTSIAEEDWLKKWKEDLRPIHVGHNFVISPPWFREQLERETENADKCVIYIEPGMAFGTGLHATTQYCLHALESYMQTHTQDVDILDVGTGSGILAIAAAKLNQQAKIIAVDIDPTCIEVAKQNIELNAVKPSVVLRDGSTDVCSNLAFDCIVANISYQDISKLLLEFLRLLRPEGQLILAGLLKEKLELLERDIESYPLSITSHKLDGEWVGVTLQRIGVVFKPIVSKVQM